MAEPHADFTDADPENQWTGKLHELAVRLRERAWKAKGEWAWFVLPQGALVAMRLNEKAEFRKELRIARREGLRDIEAAKKWMNEVRTFQKHLDCESWTPVEINGNPGGAGPTFIILQEPGPLGSVPRKCERCGDKLEGKRDPAYKTDICTKCATELGTEETAANAAARRRP